MFTKIKFKTKQWMFGSLVLLLIFTIFVAPISANESKELGDLESNITKEKKLADQNEIYDVKDEVRVLVELEEVPAIEYATQQGKKYDELPRQEQTRVEKDVKSTQDTIKTNIKQAKIDIDYIEEFTTVTNGFSAKVTFGDAKELEQLLGVKTVHIVNEYERPEATTDVNYSNETVKALQTREEFGYDGEGMLIGIIDTGVDPAHQDFVLSEETEPRLSEVDIDAHEGPGQWFTEKVPYGYNYMDKNHEILDLAPDASHHGMHVAGTAGANGDPDNGGVQGVAPEAQILALKVFGNDPQIPTTYGDIYVKAMDDAVKLGVDVLNLSLGSTAGFVDDENPEQQAVERAEENGVVVTISAGNSNLFGDGVGLPPLLQNPDIGVIGAPSISKSSFSVASSENEVFESEVLAYETEDESGLMGYGSFSDAHPSDVFGEDTVEIVHAGLGSVEDFENIDVEGEIALIERGAYAFTEKTLNAQENGAVASIIYNNETGWVNMQSIGTIEIPHLFMTQEDGNLLVRLLEEGKTPAISFDEEPEIVPNPTGGHMSDFTSWGLTPDLEFKPEITAPGGQIYSTLQDNAYGLMSGTSMAAPSVAGGSALILERVDEEFNLTGFDRSTMTRTLMMNTAEPKLDTGAMNASLELGTYYSPRRQGAGQMNLHAASSTPAYVVDSETDLAKVSLKDFQNEVSFDLTLHNIHDEALDYDVDVSLQTTFAENGYFINEESAPLENVDVSVYVDGEETSTVTVEPGSQTALKVELDLTDAQVFHLSQESGYMDADALFTNGYFAEGFVEFVETTDSYPSLSIPYVGFNGAWDAAPIVDPALYEFLGISYYQETGLIDSETSYYLGYDSANSVYDSSLQAFSPELTSVFPNISFLRNAAHVQFNILDEEGEELRTLRNEDQVRKNYFDSGLAPLSTPFPQASWDGSVNNEQVEDGQYYYEIKSIIDYEGAEWQSYTLPVYVDTEAPKLEDVLYDSESAELSWAASDVGVGISHFKLVVDGEEEAVLDVETTSFQFEEDLSEGSTISLNAYDFANNTAGERVGIDDGNVPYINIASPDLLAAYNSSEVYVSGVIENATELVDFTVNGREVDTVWSADDNGFLFAETFALEDDVHDFSFYALDEDGNDISISRKFVVDTTNPELDIRKTNRNVNEDVESVTIPVTIKDNFNDLRLKVNGNEEYYHDFDTPYEKRELTESLEVELDLEKGKNTFDFSLTDLGGNEVTETVEITRQDGSESSPGTPVPGPQPPTVPESESEELALDEKISEQLEEGTDDVKIDLRDADAVTAEISSSILKEVADNERSLTIETDETNVTLPKEVLEDLGREDNDSVSFSIKNNQKVDFDGKKSASNVYHYSIEVAKNGEKQAYTNFDTPVKVTMALDESSYEDERKVVAYYYNDGELSFVGGEAKNNELVFETDHFSQFVAINNEITFPDIKGHWGQEKIELMAAREVVEGMQTGDFKPDSPVTRAEFATLISRAFDLSITDQSDVFKDVAEDAWYSDDINKAYALGIIKGYNGYFLPNEEVTREEMATMMIRAYEQEHGGLEYTMTDSFDDGDHISEWANEAVSKAVDSGFIKGKGSGMFDPQAHTTRAEAATVLSRVLGY